MPTIMLHQYRTGIEEEVIRHHAQYYGEHWGFDDRFVTQVRTEIGHFLKEFNQECDCFWWASMGSSFAGSVAVDGSRWGEGQARLRWFIVPETAQGSGVGGLLLEQAMSFCRSKPFKGVHLWTFEGLFAARKLYERQGFVLTETEKSTGWGSSITEQKFELAP